MSDLVADQGSDRGHPDMKPLPDGVYIPRSVFHALAGVVLIGSGFAAGVYVDRAWLMSGTAVTPPAVAVVATPVPAEPVNSSTPLPAMASTDEAPADTPVSVPTASDAPADFVDMGVITPQVMVSVPDQTAPAPDLFAGIMDDLEALDGAPVDGPAEASAAGEDVLAEAAQTSRNGIDVEKISDPIVRDVVQKAISSVNQEPDVSAWAEKTFGYVPQKQPGEEVPSISGAPSAKGAAVEAWQFSDDEGGEDIPDAAVPAGPVSGSATVISSNSVSVNDTVIRIAGVVAPGLTATCSDSEGVAYDCLAWAVSGLGHALNGQDMTCFPDGVSEEGNMTGRCDVIVGEQSVSDVGSWMVRAGITLSDGAEGEGTYKVEEAEAREAGRGIWSGNFSFGDRSHES